MRPKKTLDELEKQSAQHADMMREFAMKQSKALQAQSLPPRKRDKIYPDYDPPLSEAFFDVQYGRYRIAGLNLEIAKQKCYLAEAEQQHVENLMKLCGTAENT
ncbi:MULTISPECIES: hypothetical protein [unclassified Polaromonas]|uniref:hypothetical protein n=1 Tax=unclassified Polaromonas TaxID=2638319 RepID=UPI000F07B4E0|nr:MULTISPECIES: hypothetical protein [unclassified Polaromonas]AYQ30287.1 hypothetical protein DT070_21130 [Polaromonas sp. SP1]QGJ18595.1 hypothetical protein F7R28_09445 [Polaromonas sp. Pch-P]